MCNFFCVAERTGCVGIWALGAAWTDGLESCSRPGGGVDCFSSEEGNNCCGISVSLTCLALTGPGVTSLVQGVVWWCEL